jgi:hypothetical protein
VAFVAQHAPNQREGTSACELHLLVVIKLQGEQVDISESRHEFAVPTAEVRGISDGPCGPEQAFSTFNADAKRRARVVRHRQGPKAEFIPERKHAPRLVGLNEPRGVMGRE